ncbi:MAG: sigma-54-dependent transcriptional regulator [Woeseiaceae bacterium]
MNDAAVLIVEDDADLRDALSHTLDSGMYPVLTAESGPEALSILGSTPVGLVVSDIQMEPMSGHELLGYIRQDYPDLPAVLMTAYGTIESAVDVMRNGAADYLVKPFEAQELIDAVDRHMRSQTASDGSSAFEQPVAEDPKSAELLRVARRVARSEATVTISGESGTGKEVIARFIHQKSERRDHPFVAINCAAIPENMLEAILFGHEKGAFTGASKSHAGKFEQANGGTLLLDEISEMDLSLQAKILRVIQEREVERIGGDETIELDVRVLATTNRNLRQFVADGKFREDLFYRLNVFPLHIPPLRERKADIVPLAEMLITRFHGGDDITPRLSDAAISALSNHEWTGNVRELENVIQRSLILLSGSTISPDDLAFESSSEECRPDACAGAQLQHDMQKTEFNLIVEALREVGGNKTETAARLGISPRTLRYKLARMRAAGLSVPDSVSKTTH